VWSRLRLLTRRSFAAFALGWSCVALVLGAAPAQASGARDLQLCPSSDLSLGVTTATDQGRVTITVSLHHFRGSACRLASQASVSLLSAPKGGTPLKIRGNPATATLESTLPPRGTAAVAFAWSNWCGAARKVTINGVGPFGGGVLIQAGPPPCTSKSKPSLLAASR
jgi:hypothetical protein